MIDLEKTIVGELLFNPEVLSEIDIKLIPTDFSTEKHRLVFAKIIELYENKKAVDILTIYDSLKDKFDGNDLAVYLSQLQGSVSSTAYIQSHIDSLIEENSYKGIENLGKNCRSMSLEEVQDEQEKIFNRANTDTSEISDSNKAMDELEEQLNDKSPILETDLIDLDDIIKIKKPKIVVVAARPGAGKTIMALTIAKNIAKRGKSVGFFSLEMSKSELVLRLISSECKLTTDEIEKKRPENLKLISSKAQEIRKLPIYYYDRSGIDLKELKRVAKKMKNKHKIDCFMIDYIQLMSGKGNTREAIIGDISRGLQALAKELDCPFIILSQLNRALEQRPNKKPNLSDLRESGQIEADANIVMLLYRPEMYNILTDENGDTTKNMAIAIIAKNRSGRLGEVKLRFIPEYVSFENYTNNFEQF